jgi:hypothetical protein
MFLSMSRCAGRRALGAAFQSVMSRGVWGGFFVSYADWLPKPGGFSWRLFSALDFLDNLLG